MNNKITTIHIILDNIKKFLHKLSTKYNIKVKSVFEILLLHIKYNENNEIFRDTKLKDFIMYDNVSKKYVLQYKPFTKSDIFKTPHYTIGMIYRLLGENQGNEHVQYYLAELLNKLLFLPRNVNFNPNNLKNSIIQNQKYKYRLITIFNFFYYIIVSYSNIIFSNMNSSIYGIFYTTIIELNLVLDIIKKDVLNMFDNKIGIFQIPTILLNELLQNFKNKCDLTKITYTLENTSEILVSLEQIQLIKEFLEKNNYENKKNYIRKNSFIQLFEYFKDNKNNSDYIYYEINRLFEYKNNSMENNTENNFMEDNIKDNFIENNNSMENN